MAPSGVEPFGDRPLSPQPPEAATELSRRLPGTGPVLASVGGLMTLLAVAAVVGAVLAIDLRAATGRADRHVEYVDAVNVAALNAKAIANDERGFLISGDLQFVRQMDPRITTVRDAFDAADRAAVGNAQHAAIYEVRDGFEDWLWSVRRGIQQYRSGDRKGAIASSLGETRQQRKANEAAIDRARALGQSGVEAATSSLSDASWRAVRIMLVYLVVALAVGFALTFWLVRTVLRPVNTLRRLLPEPPPVRPLR